MLWHFLILLNNLSEEKKYITICWALMFRSDILSWIVSVHFVICPHILLILRQHPPSLLFDLVTISYYISGVLCLAIYTMLLVHSAESMCTANDTIIKNTLTLLPTHTHTHRHTHYTITHIGNVSFVFYESWMMK